MLVTRRATGLASSRAPTFARHRSTSTRNASSGVTCFDTVSKLAELTARVLRSRELQPLLHLDTPAAEGSERVAERHVVPLGEDRLIAEGIAVDDGSQGLVIRLDQGVEISGRSHSMPPWAVAYATGTSRRSRDQLPQPAGGRSFSMIGRAYGRCPFQSSDPTNLTATSLESVGVIPADSTPSCSTAASPWCEHAGNSVSGARSGRPMSRSRGRDCSSRTKPAVCCRSSRVALAIELDEQEQRRSGTRALLLFGW